MTAAYDVLNNPELTHMIFQWLKTITERHLHAEEGERPSLPRSWTRNFARLTTVNRVFFYASIEVLWERLTSLMPLFGYVLPADKDKKGVPSRSLSYRTHELTPEHWNRFTLYSSRVKVLVLDDSSPKMTAAWMSHLLHSEHLPHTLFPSLQRLFLASQSPLALYIAYNCTPSVKYVHMELIGKSASNARDDAKALITGFRQNALTLTDLRLERPVTPQIINDISHISSLTSLWIKVGSKDNKENMDVGALDLGKLAKLSILRNLTIEQDFDESDRIAASVMPKGSIDIQGIASQKPKFTQLRKLSVQANGITQYQVVLTLLPVNLEVLNLVVLRDVFNIQAALIPLVATVYARRNPSLSRLQIDTDDWSDMEFTADVDALDQYRSHPQYSNMEPFLESIRGLRHLTYFSFRGVPVFHARMISDLLKISSRLPLLKSLFIEPNPMTDFDSDDLEMPNLEVLQEIAQSNPRLEELALVVDLSKDIPETAEDEFPAHGLRTISLDCYDDFDCSEEITFDLARYLESLFPQVQIRKSAFSHRDRNEAQFWIAVDRILSYSRESKSRLRRQLEKARVQTP